MSTPKSNLTLVTPPTSETGGSEFWLSDPEQMEDGGGDWGFAIFVQKDIWLATFSYCSEAAAKAARQAMVPALGGATFIATAES